MKKYKIIECLNGDWNIHTEWLDKEDAMKLMRKLQEKFSECDYWLEEHSADDLPTNEYQNSSRIILNDNDDLFDY